MTELFRQLVRTPIGRLATLAWADVRSGIFFGQYKRLANEFTGVLTGKARNWGGSLMRPEATGYGAVYFAQEMLKTRNETIEGKICTVSGAGNAAQFTVEKLIECGAKPITISDSSGFIYDKKRDHGKKNWPLSKVSRTCGAGALASTPKNSAAQNMWPANGPGGSNAIARSLCLRRTR